MFRVVSTFSWPNLSAISNGENPNSINMDDFSQPLLICLEVFQYLLNCCFLITTKWNCSSTHPGSSCTSNSMYIYVSRTFGISMFTTCENFSISISLLFTIEKPPDIVFPMPE